MRGHPLAGMHDFAHVGELGAELAARMKSAEIERGEAAALEQRDRQRIAEHELHGRRGRRSKAVGAGLRCGRQGQAHVGLAAERAVGVRGHRDQRNGVALGEGDDRREFGRLARPGYGEHHVAILHHAEVAMARLRRMNERCRLASRGKRCRDLARDVPGLAHAGQDDPAGRRRDGLDRFRERRSKRPLCGVADRFLKRLEALPLVGDGADGGEDGARRFLNHGPLFIIGRRSWKTGLWTGAREIRADRRGQTPPPEKPSLRNSSLRPGARSPRSSAKARLAVRNPSLDPQS